MGKFVFAIEFSLFDSDLMVVEHFRIIQTHENVTQKHQNMLGNNTTRI